MATMKNVLPTWITKTDADYRFWGEALAKLIGMGKLVQMDGLEFPKLDSAYAKLLDQSKEFKAFFESLPGNERVNAKRAITNVATFNLFQNLSLYDKYRDMLRAQHINTVDEVPMDLRKALLRVKVNGVPVFENLAATRFGNTQITALARIWLRDSAKTSPAVSEFLGIVHQHLLEEGRKILDGFAKDGETPSLNQLTYVFESELATEMANMVGDLHSFQFESDGRMQAQPGPFMDYLNRQLVAADRQLKGVMPVAAFRVWEDHDAHDYLKVKVGKNDRVTFTVWISEKKEKDGRGLIVWTQKTFSNVFVVSMGMKDGGYEFELKSKDGDPIRFYNRNARSLVVWEQPKWFNHKIAKIARFGGKDEPMGEIDTAIADLKASSTPRNVIVEDSSEDQE